MRVVVQCAPPSTERAITTLLFPPVPLAVVPAVDVDLVEVAGGIAGQWSGGVGGGGVAGSGPLSCDRRGHLMPGLPVVTTADDVDEVAAT
jgi:hypothetical protein